MAVISATTDSVNATGLGARRQARMTLGAAAATAVLGAAAALAGCGPMVETAPFSYRPDTMSTGDLLGPYDGQVVDAETDRPVAGAVVAGSWAFERGVGLQGPAGAVEVVTQTGADGRYRLPVLNSMPTGASMRVRRFTLIVYQRGYVGWRSDRRFPEGRARRDFSQRQNRVRLEKWREDLQHHRHLVFLGGGAAVRAAAQWEVQPASLELDGTPGRRTTGVGPAGTTAGAPAPLDASILLSEQEVRGVTGYAGPLDVAKLTDLPTTEFYDSRHFKAQGKPESFDVGLRVWRLGEAGAEAQYRKLLTELPGASPADEVGDASLRARAGDVLGLAFLLRRAGVVVSLTCGANQCPEPAMLVRLGKLVESHVPELPAPGTAPANNQPAPGTTPAGNPPAPGTSAAPPGAPAPTAPSGGTP